jgi:FKBP-type peptidyl-prolyl cis-trans isomerase
MVKILFSFLLVVLIVSCSDRKKTDVASGNTWNDSTSVGFNKDRLKEEELQINLYLSHHTEMKVLATGTGLRYQIYKKSNGVMAESSDSVEVSMKISLLNGVICYQTDSTDVDQFLVDKSNVESGVQEGIKFMKEGEKARFILPSNLAHGLLGDFEKIPPMSPIVVDIELVKVLKNIRKG